MPSIITPPQRNIKAAKELFSRGLWVVPIQGKKATAKKWPSKKVELHELETALHENGRLGIGLVLNRSPYVDIECDAEDGEDQIKNLFGSVIPITPTWTSPRGKHRLFLRPEGLPERAVIRVGDVEIRGACPDKGALSVIPPSAGRTWLPKLSLSDVDPVELPANVIDKIREPIEQNKDNGTDENDRIPEGKRNDTLFDRACSLAELKLSEQEIADTLLSFNNRMCDPPLAEQEVRAIAKSAASGDRPGIGFLARLLGEIDLWHCDQDEPFATVVVGEHRENWRIGKRNKQWKRWISRQFYFAAKATLKDADLAEISTLLEAKALFDGAQHQLWRRVAEHDGKFYLDLCDDEWRAVEIDATGWRVLSDPPAKFFRAKAMTALPMPETTTGAETLRSLLLPFLNIKPQDWPLVAVWLAAALRPRGPYPICKLLGEQGSAKSTAARVLRQLVDPNSAPLRAEPKSNRDLVISANNAWLLCLDNLSSVKTDLSDALCRLSTGGGFSTRSLYTDDDETIFEATRPAILTSIEEIGSRSDLLERSLILELPKIEEESRRTEKQFWAEFEKVQPKILGALLNAISGGIKNLPREEQQCEQLELARLADFELWGRAAEEPLGLRQGEFSEAYAANREAANGLLLESCPLAAALLSILRKTGKPIEGTATELLDKVNWQDSENRRKLGWPKTPRVLSAILRRVAPNLRLLDIVCDQHSRGGGNEKQRVWRIVPPPGFGDGSEERKRKKQTARLAKEFRARRKQNKANGG